MAYWLSKPLYESLPYLYVVVGVLLVAASRLLEAGSWRLGSIALGVALVLVGALLAWHRRRYRQSR